MASKALFAGVVTLIAGASIAFFNMFRWSAAQETIANAARSPGTVVLEFYLAQGLSTVLVVTGIYVLYKVLLARQTAETPTVRSVIGDALSSKKALRIGAVVAVLYAAAYAFFSSLLTFQPTVNFATTYGVTSPTWTYVTCCGDTGTVPKLVIYISPSLHLGMVLVPLTLLFFFVVPMLVGFNVALSYFAFKQSTFPMSERWLLGSGAVVGLFTACPTCAGLFLASSIGGVGTTLAIALAPFQLLFVAITIPVLMLGPVLTALTVKRSYEASCRVPAAAGTGNVRTG